MWLSAWTLQSDMRSQCHFWTASTQFVQNLGLVSSTVPTVITLWINLRPAATDSELCPPRGCETTRPTRLSVAPLAMLLDGAPTRSRPLVNFNQLEPVTRVCQELVHLRGGTDPPHRHVDMCTARGTHLHPDAWLQQHVQEWSAVSFLETHGFPLESRRQGPSLASSVKLGPLQTTRPRQALDQLPPRHPENSQASLSGVCDLAAQASELEALSSKKSWSLGHPPQRETQVQSILLWSLAVH